jgi:DNA ligase N terminus
MSDTVSHIKMEGEFVDVNEDDLPYDIATNELHDEEVDNFREFDDPVAEGDEPPKPKLEPSEQKASSMKFFTLCVALEAVWKAGVQKKKWSDVQKLWKVLPPKFLHWLDTPSNDDDGRPESIFPILRLLLPEKDGSRQFQMAESTLGVMYGSALAFAVQSNKYRMLLHYSDPNSGLTKAQGLGDFSTVVQTVVGSTKINDPNGSGYTVGRINEALDVLASLPGKARHLKSNHDWKNEKDRNSIHNVVGNRAQNQKSNNKAPTLKTLRVQWLRQLNEGNINCSGLSPLEHKWLVRILLKKMQFGLVRTYGL